MSYLKPNTAGVYDIPSANIDTLYVRGKKFQDYITELVIEDNLEQSEIDELKLLLQYLNTSGLSSEWIIDNNNKNQDLKNAITLIQTKLANIDTTALTESSVLTNDNRNSVLKTAIDTAATDLTTLTSRVTTAEGDIDNLETRMTTAEGDIDGVETRMTTAEGDINSLETRETASENNITAIKDITDYIAVSNGDPEDDTTAHGLYIGTKLSVPADATKAARKEATLGVGRLEQGFSVVYDPNINAEDGNRVAMVNRFGGYAIVSANHTRIQGGTEVNIGEVGLGVAAYETINIGGSMSTINIGSVDDPELGYTPGDPATGKSTTITIGKRTTLKNTWTYLQGNFYTSESRWEDLAVTDVVSIETAASWFAGYVFSGGLPYWLAWVGLSGTPNYRYSDIVKMANNYQTGGLTKNHSIETSNDISVKNIRVMDFTVVSLETAFDAILARLVFQAFAVHGSHSIGSIWGRTNIYAGSGEIELRVDGGAFDWAFKNAGNSNRVFLDNDHVEVVQCNGSGGGGRLRLVAANGNIELSTAQGGVRSSATKVMELTYQKQIIIGDDTTMSDSTYKMLIDTTSHDNGIKVAKGSNELLLNPDNVSSKSLTLQSGYTGTTANTLYTNADNKLMWNNAISSKALTLQSDYTGTTANTLYTNADNKLMWNGSEVGSGGSSSGGSGVDYYIPLANNIVNPAPNPTIQFMDELYVSDTFKTIKQSTTAVATGLLMASYRTPIFNKESNPTILGVQTVQQWLDWSENNTVGQIYGRLYYEAYVSNNNLLYDRKYTNVVSTSYATVINGTPINAPASLFLIQFQRVLFEFVDIDVTGTSCEIKCRLEGQDLLTENWNILQTSSGTKTYTSDSINQNIDFTGENFFYEKTTATNAPIKYRVSLFVSNGGGSIRQTVAGGTDLGAYQLGSVNDDFARIRVLLYDGINQKKTIQHSTTPSLLSLDLPVSVPYNISPFNFSRLGVELYMYQPTGAVNSNHIMTFYFNDGYISHFETSLNFPPVATPTLSEVMTSGATASSDLSMGNYGITNVASIQNWNVKDLTQGDGITITDNNGNYTITADNQLTDYSVKALTQGDRITITNDNNGNYTITADDQLTDYSVKALTEGDRITITDDNNGNYTITADDQVSDYLIKNITAGAGIDVQINSTTKTATITNLGITGQANRDEDQALVEVGALPRKPVYWATNWVEADASAASHRDIYVSVDGKYIVSASGSFNALYSRDFGTTWNSGDVNIEWTSVCGTSQGSKIFGFATFIAQNQVQSLVFYTSANQGVNWTQRASATFSGLTKVHRVRCSGDGTYVIATVTTPATGGRFLFSSNGTADIPTWTSKQLLSTLPSGRTEGACMARSGATQFMTWIRDDGSDSKIFRSFDYGNTWTEVQGNLSGGKWTHIECDATGRFIWATRFDTVNNMFVQAYRSDNYGSSWNTANMNSIEDIWVSGTGQFMAGVSVPNTSLSNNRFLVYSSDYGQTVQIHPVSNTTLLRTINGSADGSILVIGSASGEEGGFQSDGKIRIARQGLQNIQDLSVVGGTLTKAGGVYTYTLPNFNYSEELWFSGGFEIQTGNPQFKVDFDWSAAGKIDLNQYNIRYEIDCYWSTGTWTYVYPLLAINDILNTDVQGTSENLSHQELSGLTNWTNNINNGSFGGSEVYTQTYNNRFFAAYFPGSTNNASAGANSLQRQKSIIKGTLSLHRRPEAQTGILDGSENARDILNIFTCDNYSTRFYSSFSYLMNSNAQQGIDYGVNHQRINGTALFAASPIWTYDSAGGGSQLANGIYRLGFHLSEGGTTTIHRPRAAHYTYRIYRERK